MRRDAETSGGADASVWRIRGAVLDLSVRPLVMGIVNVTPDSFSDGGRWADPGAAIAHGCALVAEGADLLDIGGESTRPGAAPVDAAEERRRIEPVLAGLARAVRVPLSVDTAKAAVAAAACDAGAAIVNDVTAGSGDPAMFATVARAGAGMVLMHMQGTPRTMQQAPQYGDVVREVRDHLAARLDAAVAAGVPREACVVDPGLGFGKTLAHNCALLRELERLAALLRPVLVGPSRKAFLGALLDLPVSDRLEGTLAAVTAAVLHGARLVRVHDVRATVRAVRVAAALVAPGGAETGS